MPDARGSSTSSIVVETLPWYDQRHHAENGFRNIWGNDRETPFFRMMGWFLKRGFSDPEHEPPPVRPVESKALTAAPREIRFTWLGHSTVYIQTGSISVLLDPMFSARASPVSFAGPARIPPIPLPLEELPSVNVVIISHDHYDHLDEDSIRRLHQAFNPTFLVPLGVGEIVAGWGAEHVFELDWWQAVTVGTTRITCVPAQHFSGRGLTNRDGTLWAGWHLSATDTDASVFYAGDTGYATHFQEVRERLGTPDVALLPIGAYLPRWFMQVVHVSPEEALDAFEDLGARHFLPVHWGTFDLADDLLQEPPARLRAAAEARGIQDKIHILDIGESLEL